VPEDFHHLYRLGHVMTRAGGDEARNIATTAAVDAGIAGATTPAAVLLRGSLALIGAIAAARQDDRRDTLGLLREAGQLADRLGDDRNDHWTAFGPTNVRIHAASAAVELGDPGEATIHGETVESTPWRPASSGDGRRCTSTSAWAYGQWRNDPATVLSLLVRECMKRERRAATPGLRGLAERVGIMN
jgi:hypothetical protein